MTSPDRFGSGRSVQRSAAPLALRPEPPADDRDASAEATLDAALESARRAVESEPAETSKVVRAPAPAALADSLDAAGRRKRADADASDRAAVSTRSRWTGVKAPAPRALVDTPAQPRERLGLFSRLSRRRRLARGPARSKSAGERLTEIVQDALAADLAGETLAVETVLDCVTPLRATVALWIDGDCASGGVDPASRQMVFDDVEKRLRTDPWQMLSARQGRMDIAGRDGAIACAVHFATPSTDAASLNALSAVERHYDVLAARRGFAPRLVSLQREGETWRAVFEAEVPVAAVRVDLGRRSPRIARTLLALGAPLALVSEEALIDELHDRALDRTRLSPEAHADRMAESAAGRRALASAASAEPRGKFIEKSADLKPWLSARGAGRLHDLASRCHPALGLRMRRWLWPVAALGAPLLAAALALAAAQYSDVALRLGRDGAVGIASLFSVLGWGPPSAERTTAAVFAGLLPYALFWVVALGVLAHAFGRRTRAVLGFARRLTMREIFGRGAGPWGAMTAGALLYAVSFFGLSLGLSETGFRSGAQASAAAETAGETDAATLPVAMAGAPSASGARWWAPGWFVENDIARTWDETGLASLSARCDASVGALTLKPEAIEQRDADGALLSAGTPVAIIGAEWATVLIDGQEPFVAIVESGADGALSFALPAPLIEGMRNGRSLSLDLLDTAGQPVGGFVFSLKDSGAAIDAAIPACRVSP